MTRRIKSFMIDPGHLGRIFAGRVELVPGQVPPGAEVEYGFWDHRCAAVVLMVSHESFAEVSAADTVPDGGVLEVRNVTSSTWHDRPPLT